MTRETSSNPREQALSLDCGGQTLLGVLHHGRSDATVAMIVVVGGRQYRVGAHRQFVQLARYLARQGIPVLRFDLRGMGDSQGSPRHFLEIEDDINCACQAIHEQLPQVQHIALWGLCDGASASVLYAQDHPDILGTMMVNPWITTESGMARTYLKHYYIKRIREPAFWLNLLSGKLNFRSTVKMLARSLVNFLPAADTVEEIEGDDAQLPDMVFAALKKLPDRVAVVISDNDLTAREFDDEYQRRIRSGAFGKRARVQVTRVAADHTFSTPVTQLQLNRITAAWIQSLQSVMQQ